MKKVYLITVIAVLALAFAYIMMPSALNLEQACTSSGGTISTSLCCASASDFPNTCTIGACGCSPSNSREVKVCDCGEGKCWDSEKAQCV